MQKSTILCAFLLVAGASAAPGFFDAITSAAGNVLTSAGGAVTTGLGTVATGVGALTSGVGAVATDVVTGVATGVGDVATGVATGVGAVVGGAASLVDGAVTAVVDVAIGTGQVVFKFFDALTGTMIDGSVDANGNIINAAGTIIGNIENSINVAEGNILDEAGNIIGNIFTDNGFKPIMDSTDGIIGQVTQIGGYILKTPYNVFANFVPLVTGLIGNLENFSADYTKGFINLGSQLTTIGTGIGSIFDKFFKAALTTSNVILTPVLNTAATIFGKVAGGIASANNDAITQIAAQYKSIISNTLEAFANAAEQVTNLIADHNTFLNQFNASVEAKLACGAIYNDSLQLMATTAISDISNCIVPSSFFNIDDLANKALATVGGISTQAGTLVASLQTCITKFSLLNPASTVTCLKNIISTSATVQQTMYNTIKTTVSALTADFATAASAIQSCLNTDLNKASLTVMKIGEDLKTCLQA